ncbi:MAG: hypothetical protein ACK4FK_05545 [Ferrovibrio sp.]|uniref:hypothetical protein n=1 Tax=Ferrovibrio sp. TaxID=1917215 RepID=UPI003919001C
MNELQTIRSRLSAFISECCAGFSEYQLTSAAEATPYGRCFAVFLRHLLKDPALAADGELPKAIVHDIKTIRSQPGVDIESKPYRQLLTFSLSALAILPGSSPRLLDDFVSEQLSAYDAQDLERLGCMDGRPGSGNQAMFLAIFLIHGRDHLGLDTQPLINHWVAAHLQRMNRFGFWGPDGGMTHLQFQNGYHQHEILEYLGVKNPHLESTLAAVCNLADHQGHFAPYPGGGGCYDYDAVFMLTPEGKIPDDVTRELLLRTSASIIDAQRPDGGFAESLRVRPRSLDSLIRFASHTLNAFGSGALFAERLRYALTLQRPKHDRIHTHWSRYSRRWDESDLWDSWFRMLTLARIDVALHPEHADNWGFIDYPGIGYHPSLKSGNRFV